MKNIDYVRGLIKEIIPIVEEKSGLECDIKKTEIKLTNNILRPILCGFIETPFGDFYGFLKNSLIYHYHLSGSFHPFSNSISFPKKKVNMPQFKGYLAHELMHNAQFNSFSNLYEFLLNKEKFSEEEFKTYHMLIEGDASLIEEKFSKKKGGVNLPKNILKFIGEDYYNNFVKIKRSEIYDKGKKILKRKFNGNRKDINELYTAPIEELVKIFK